MSGEGEFATDGITSPRQILNDTTTKSTKNKKSLSKRRTESPKAHRRLRCTGSKGRALAAFGYFVPLQSIEVNKHKVFEKQKKIQNTIIKRFIELDVSNSINLYSTCKFS